MRRISGRANSSKVTRALTGLPGRPITGTPLHRAEGERLARLHADAPEVERTQALDHVAHVVVTPDRHAAGRHQQVGFSHATQDPLLDLRRIVRGAFQGQGFAAALGDGRRQGDPVGVVDLARRQRRARRLQLVAGRQDRDPRATTHGQLAHAKRCQQAQRGGA